MIFKKTLLLGEGERPKEPMTTDPQQRSEKSSHVKTII